MSHQQNWRFLIQILDLVSFISSTTWIFQDFFWIAEYYVISLIFGGLALIGVSVTLVKGLYFENINEVWHAAGKLIWISGNMMWTLSETQKHPFTLWTPIFFSVGLIWLLLYHLLVSMAILPKVALSDKLYLAHNIEPRFTIFPNYRFVMVLSFLCSRVIFSSQIL